MNSSRLSLSSPSLNSRIKKFDTYQRNNRTSKITTRPQLKIVNSHHLQSTSTPSNVIFKSTKSYAPTAAVESRSNSPVQPRILPIQPSTRSNFTKKLALDAVQKSPRVERTIESQFVEPVVTKSRKATLFQRAFYTLGAVIFLFAGGVSVQTLINNQNAKEQLGVLGEQTQTTDEQGAAEGTGSDPAEGEVSAQAIANYKVHPELPRYLRIPEIGVFARIKHTGVTKEGAVDAPKNINDVSWYNEGAAPGNSRGSSLLLGHVSGWTGPGVFKKIDTLKPGMRFEIEKGSGEKLTYEVTRGEKIPLDQVDMSKILGVEVAGEHDLKMMTCSGRYNKDTDQFEERYVVYAKIIR